MINVFFYNFNHYLDIFSESVSKVSVQFMFSSSNSVSEIQNKFIFDSTLSLYENHTHRVLFQMNKKLHLAIFITQKK